MIKSEVFCFQGLVRLNNVQNIAENQEDSEHLKLERFKFFFRHLPKSIKNE